MKVLEFSQLWDRTFNKDTNNLDLELMKEVGLDDAQRQKFIDAWDKIDVLHQAEKKIIMDELIKNQVLFVNEEIRAKYRLKIHLEKTFIRWLLDAYQDEKDIKQAMEFLVNTLALKPEYFSDIVCQSVWRLIISRYQHQMPFGLVDLIKDIEFIDITELVDFYLGEEDEPPRSIFLYYPSLVMAAEQIMQLNNLLVAETGQEETIFGGRKKCTCGGKLELKVMDIGEHQGVKLYICSNNCGKTYRVEDIERRD